MNGEMDYEEFMDIDESSLDVEWLEQPKKMVQMVQHAANINRELAKTKDRLSQVKAELAKKIRSKPEKYGIEKITENAIFETIQTTDEYKEANEEYLDAMYEAEVASGSVKATEQRKSSLENLVKLHGQQYFAGPRVPRDLATMRIEYQEKQKRKKDVAGKIGKSLKRKKLNRTK